jgi:quercetin dioxygenase-like cupin family protein
VALFLNQDFLQLKVCNFEGLKDNKYQLINYCTKMATNEFEKSKVFSFNESIDYSDGGIVSKTVLKKQTGNISLFSFDKGEALSEHTAPFDAIILAVDGSGEIMIGGKSFLLTTGHSIIMPANITHAVKAVEKFKMVLIMIKSI